MRAAGEDHFWAFVAAAALVAAALGLTAIRYAPPRPKPIDAPANEFSATRAHQLLSEMLRSNAPHPVGSAEDARIREWLLARFQSLGLAAELRDGFACGAHRVCAYVHSIVARLPGQQTGKAVLLNAHYDSVKAGPGASDDGVGVVAILEVARAFKAEPPHRNPVLFLVNEGEEPGLIGAEALAQDPTFASSVGAVVNLEARGTTGPSLMFETSAGNAWLMDVFARHVERPVTNSLYYAFYRRLPNDTDLTVFKRLGLPGFGLAFIGRADQYHTPLDDVAHADPGSLQHHGQNALALVRALADADLSQHTDSDDVFFDVFAWKTVHWPAAWMSVLSLTAFAGVLAAVLRLHRKKEVTLSSTLRGAIGSLAAIIASGAVAIAALVALKKLGTLPYPWVAHSSRLQWLMAMLGVAVSVPFFARQRRAAGWSAWSGTWLLWSVASMAAAYIDASLSYVVVVPSAAAAAAGLIVLHSPLPLGEGRGEGNGEPRSPFLAAATIVPLSVLLTLWIPVSWLLYDGMGTGLVAALAPVSAIIGSAVSPLTGGARSLARLVGTLTAAASMAAFIACALAKPFTPENPRHLNVAFHLDGNERRAWWEVDQAGPDIPPSLTQSASFTRNQVSPLRWLPKYRVHTARAPMLPLAQPELRVQEDLQTSTGRGIRARLISGRGAPEAGVALPIGRVRSLSMEGAQPPPAPENRRKPPSPFGNAGLIELRCVTLPPEGVEVSIEVDGTDPLMARVWDVSRGLPPQGQFLVDARAANTCPVQNGDETLVSHQLNL